MPPPELAARRSRERSPGRTVQSPAPDAAELDRAAQRRSGPEADRGRPAAGSRRRSRPSPGPSAACRVLEHGCRRRRSSVDRARPARRSRGSVEHLAAAGAGRVRTSTPSTTVSRSPSSAARPSATLTWYGGLTCAEPPPMPMVSTACRPISATVWSRGQRQHAVVGQHGHARARPAGSAAPGAVGQSGAGRSVGNVARLAERADPVGEPQQPAHVVVDRPPRRPRRPRPRRPARRPTGPSGPGITRSSPPLAAGAAVLVANQSDMIRPS